MQELDEAPGFGLDDDEYDEFSKRPHPLIDLLIYGGCLILLILLICL